MDGDTGYWLFALIYLLISLVSWLGRRSKAKAKRPAEPEPGGQTVSAAASKFPPDAQQLLARAAASTTRQTAVPIPNPFAGDPTRASIYSTLNLRETEYLLQNWYEDDPTQWSDAAFEVIERILVERLGELPARSDAAEEAAVEGVLEPSEDTDPQVKELWAERDLDGLAMVLRHDPDWIVRMDAAEALAALGDPRGRDHLLAALEDPADDVRAVASEILDGLQAAAGKPSFQQPEPEPRPEPMVPAVSAGVEPPARNAGEMASASDIWAAYRDKQAAFESKQMARAPGSRDLGLPSMAPITGDASAHSRTSFFKPYLLAGAAGGALAFFGSYLLVYLGGEQIASGVPALRFASQLGFWLIPLDIAVGAASGVIGDLVARNLAGHLGHESAEGDAAPMIGAGAGGLIGALAVNAMLLAISGM